MELFHLLNRGFEKRPIVKDDSDRLRFVHSLFIFNDRKYVNPNHRRQRLEATKRDRLVDIHSWCLMNNHYHLLVSPTNDDIENISLFMKKLNMGYAKYFNERHNRSGYLWQGRYKKLGVKTDNHFIHIPYYIHLNPLDYVLPEWRQGKVKDLNHALQYLDSYRWSSYLDYFNQKNFNSVISSGFLSEVMGTKEQMITQIKNVISSPVIADASSILE